MEGVLSDRELIKACSEDKFFQSNGIRETFTHSPDASKAAGSTPHVEVSHAPTSEEDERISGLCSCLPLQSQKFVCLGL